jgi:hypothetical protein
MAYGFGIRSQRAFESAMTLPAIRPSHHSKTPRAQRQARSAHPLKETDSSGTDGDAALTLAVKHRPGRPLSTDGAGRRLPHRRRNVTNANRRRHARHRSPD